MRTLTLLFFFLPSLAFAQEGVPELRHYYPVPAANPPKTVEADVCVYGGTPGGVMMAVQASRMGKSAVLVVFRKHVGGMTSGGLSAVDLGRGDSIAGIAGEFLKRVGQNGNTFKAKIIADATYEGDLFAKAGVSFHVVREANSVYQ